MDDFWSRRRVEDLAREQGARAGDPADLDALFADYSSPEEAAAFMAALAELE